MDGLWGLAQIVALVAFVVSLAKGKGFWKSVKMSAGVLVLGLVAALALTLVAGVLNLVFGLLSVVVWLALLYVLAMAASRFIKGVA